MSYTVENQKKETFDELQNKINEYDHTGKCDEGTRKNMLALIKKANVLYTNNDTEMDDEKKRIIYNATKIAFCDKPADLKTTTTKKKSFGYNILKAIKNSNKVVPGVPGGKTSHKKKRNIKKTKKRRKYSKKNIE